MFFKKKTPKSKKKPTGNSAKKKRAKQGEGAPTTPKKTEKPPIESSTPKKLSPAEAREKLKEGWFRTIMTFELAGKPRTHIEKTLKSYILNIKNDSRVLSLNEEYAEALEHDDGIFSAFVEMEALIQDLETLTWIAINFMPASIEVQEPERVPVEARIVTNWYNDLLSKLHELSTILREERAVNTHLTEAMNALIKNAILASVRDGQKTTNQIQGITGIVAEQLTPFLKHLVEKGRLKEKDGAYALP